MQVLFSRLAVHELNDAASVYRQIVSHRREAIRGNIENMKPLQFSVIINSEEDSPQLADSPTC